jgi:hypothetical protein
MGRSPVGSSKAMSTEATENVKAFDPSSVKYVKIGSTSIRDGAGKLVNGLTSKTTVSSDDGSLQRLQYIVNTLVNSHEQSGEPVKFTIAGYDVTGENYGKSPAFLKSFNYESKIHLESLEEKTEINREELFARKSK